MYSTIIRLALRIFFLLFYIKLNSDQLLDFQFFSSSQSAEGWEYKEKIEKHASQKDYSAGFGGKFGVEADRQDKSAVGWDYVEKLEKHESQKGIDKVLIIQLVFVNVNATCILIIY